MGTINWGRVVMGGLVAGVVLNIFDYLVYGVWLMPDFEAAFQALGREPMSNATIWIYVAWDFVFGIFLIWLYAAIRPRFGAGPKAAVIAGLAMWFVFGLLHSIGEAPMGLFPTRIYVIGTLVALVQMPLAALAGARLYQEGEAGPAAPA